MSPRPPKSTLFPYTTLFRSFLRRPADQQPASGQLSGRRPELGADAEGLRLHLLRRRPARHHPVAGPGRPAPEHARRSEEHTSELQSQSNLVCRLLLEKKKKK